MMKGISWIWMCLLGWTAFAQQSPQFSQFARNQYMFNPGATGAYDFVDITLGGRMQWLGVENAPKTSYLYISAPVSEYRRGRINRTYGVIRRGNKSVKHPKMHFSKGGHAAGGYVLADQYGPYRQLKAMGSYAYHIRLDREYMMSFGLNAGISNRLFQPDKAQVYSVLANTGQVDATYAQYAANQGAQYTMDMESGIFFYGKQVFAGISVNQLTSDLVQFGNRDFNFDPRRHLFVSGGYTFHVNQRTTITPAFLIKYVRPAPVSFELSGQVEYMERLWCGLSYRHGDAIVGMIGTVISDSFKFGYSFDFNINRFNQYSAGGHEIVLGVMLGRKD